MMLLEKALKGYLNSYEIPIVNQKDPFAQLKSTRTIIEIGLASDLTKHHGLKYQETMKVKLKKITPSGKGKVRFTTYIAYFNSKVNTITNSVDINGTVYDSIDKINEIYKG